MARASHVEGEPREPEVLTPTAAATVERTPMPIKARTLESMSPYGGASWYLRRLKKDAGDSNFEESPALTLKRVIHQAGALSRHPGAKESGLATERARRSAVYFLREACGAIDDELGERSREAAGDAVPSRACRRRKDLRTEFAANEESELESLQRAVKRREAEVERLRYHRCQLQQRLEERRARVSAAMEVAKAGPNGLRGVNGKPRESTARESLETFEKELSEALHRDADEEQEKEAFLNSRQRELNRLLMQRRSKEAALMVSEAKNLDLSSRAMHGEARAAKFAQELRRLNLHMVDMVDEQLNRTTDNTAAQTACLDALSRRYKGEFLKYLEPHEMKVRAEEIDAELSEEREKFQVISEKLQKGEEPLKSVKTVPMHLAKDLNFFVRICEKLQRHCVKIFQRKSISLDNLDQLDTATNSANDAETMADTVDKLSELLFGAIASGRMLRPPDPDGEDLDIRVRERRMALKTPPWASRFEKQLTMEARRRSSTATVARTSSM